MKRQAVFLVLFVLWGAAALAQEGVNEGGGRAVPDLSAPQVQEALREADHADDQAQAYYKDGSYASAASSFRKALQAFRRAGFHDAEADALAKRAEEYRAAGEYAEAAWAYSVAALRYRLLAAEAVMQQAMASPGGPNGPAVADTGPTQQHADDAAAGPTLAHANAEVAAGGRCFEVDDYAGAWRHWQRALQICQALGEEAAEAQVLNNLGVLAHKLGQYEEAEGYYRRALETFSRLGLEKEMAATLNNLGTLADNLGRYEEAEGYFRRALQIYSRLGREREIADTLNNLGVLAHKLGQYEEAEGYYRRALETFSRLGLEKEMAATVNNLGALAQNLGRYEEAEGYYRRALGIYRRLGLVGTLAARTTGWKLGDLAVLRGEYDEALRLYREYGARSVACGWCYLCMGRLEDAGREFRDGVELAREVRNAEVLGAFLIGLGYVRERQGRLAEAAKYFREAVDLFEEQRERLTPGKRLRFLAGRVLWFQRIEAYEGLVRVEAKLGHKQEAFRWAEHTKGRVLAETMARGGTAAHFKIRPELNKQETDLMGQIAATHKRLKEAREKGQSDLIEQLEEKLAKLRSQQEALIQRLRREYPEYASIKYPQPLEASQLALKPGEVLIEYEVTGPMVVIFFVRGSRVEKMWTVDVSRQELEQKINAYLEAMHQAGGLGVMSYLRTLDLDAGRWLYEKLLKEPLGQLREGERVVIVPDEQIGILPLEALPVGGEARWEQVKPEGVDWKIWAPRGVQWVGDRYVFSYWQSATSLSVWRRLNKQVKGKKVLLVSDPVYSVADARVSGKGEGVQIAQAPEDKYRAQMRREIQAAVAKHTGFRFGRLGGLEAFRKALRRLYGKRLDVLEGLDAREAEVRSRDLEEYSRVVFATHGISDAGVPWLLQPALVLSQVGLGANEDGYLTMTEIMDLDMPAEVVCALACETGLGKRVRGEGVMALGRAFQYAGARSALVSLWSVENVSSNLVGETFLEQLDRAKVGDKAAAIMKYRQALREAGFDHPYFWAAFVLYGETDIASHVTPATHHWLLWLIVLAIVGVAIVTVAVVARAYS